MDTLTVPKVSDVPKVKWSVRYPKANFLLAAFTFDMIGGLAAASVAVGLHANMWVAMGLIFLAMLLGTIACCLVALVEQACFPKAPDKNQS